MDDVGKGLWNAEFPSHSRIDYPWNDHLARNGDGEIHRKDRHRCKCKPELYELFPVQRNNIPISSSKHEMHLRSVKFTKLKSQLHDVLNWIGMLNVLLVYLQLQQLLYDIWYIEDDKLVQFTNGDDLYINAFARILI